METYRKKLSEFTHKYWHFTVLEANNGYARVFVKSTATAQRINVSWLAYKNLAVDPELCIMMLKRQLKAELEYVNSAAGNETPLESKNLTLEERHREA